MSIIESADKLHVLTVTGKLLNLRRKNERLRWLSTASNETLGSIDPEGLDAVCRRDLSAELSRRLGFCEEQGYIALELAVAASTLVVCIVHILKVFV